MAEREDRKREQPSFQSTQDIDMAEGEPASGGHHGQDRTKWEGKDEMYGQGPKTLAKQREQNRRAT